MEHFPSPTDLIETITIKEIGEKNLLPEVGKDKRTITKWLIRHNADILGSRIKYVLRAHFEYAKVQAYYDELKKKHGDKWTDVLQAEWKVLTQHKSYIQQFHITDSIPQIFPQIETPPAFINPPEEISFYSMKNNQPIAIKLPKPSEDCSGLFFWCIKHHVTFSLGKRSCPGSKKDIGKCNNGDWRYKGVIHKHGNSDIRFTKLLSAENFVQAVKELSEFKEEKLSEKNPAMEQVKITPIIVPTEPKNFSDKKEDYIKFLNNEDVPAHRQVLRSKEHIKDVKRVLEDFKQCLTAKGYNPEQLPIAELDDAMVGFYHEHLLKKRKVANRTYNKTFSILATFIRWAQEKDKSIVNVFERVKHRPVALNPSTINKEVILNILDKTNIENGLRESKGNGEVRQYFFPFLKTAFKLGLLSGCRREELTSMKLSAIIQNADGIPVVLKVENFKINHQKSLEGKEKRYHYLPISLELRELVYELGYQEYRKNGMDKFLIAPEIIGKNRNKYLSEAFSRCFNHFAEKAGYSGLHFGILRKTFISRLQIVAPGVAKEITHPTSSGVLQHYIDREQLARSIAATNFKILQDEKEVKINELSTIRNQNKIKETITIER